MPDGVVQVGLLGPVVAAVLLGCVAFFAAALDGVFVARLERRPVRSGVASPVWEVARLLRQRRRSVVAADSLLWRVGVSGLLVVALLKVAVVPLGSWVVADLSVGVVWFNAMDVMVWALVWMAGWGANSAFSLVGGYRFLGQALSYELPLMFALTAPVVAAGSLRVGDIVTAQEGLWFVVWMPVAFLVFCAGVIAFSVWGPFSSALGRDIGGGVLVELSGVDRLLLLAGRYALLSAGAGLAVALFLGGGSGPFAPPWVWTLMKTLVVLLVFVGARRVFAVVRPDRLVEAAWMVFLPVVLLQVLFVSLVVVGR
ncbi:NADH-quinone oxidoreductase subunit H [Arthrobacter echini]|uniref:NADH-quinone oxidoreductase subunit H n=2 Tax=Arthrobacter echini TaxID=1529066 RepID=A0A4S5E0H0_9MICC|nr:complex I subunit 1 family protein [Arthrobacter echini]THJ64808.1 NADH-quinone oxidoreductase subunit H [Arthrobacter echini]TYC97133.1 NADH-quinone oxidoreductase subunit H [Arthrobacter echini]